MIKVIPADSFEFGVPVARLVDVHSRGIDKSWMIKRAAVMTREISDIRPEKGYSFIHLIDMGAQEAYGPNRNGDGFNEKAAQFELIEPLPGCPKFINMGGGLMDYHSTFEKYAHVYKHHQNKDPQKAIGEVKVGAYNEDMRRGELVIKVPNDHPDWTMDLQKLAEGKDIPFSMACKVAEDICSHCGNRAKTRAEYCDHLRDNMGDIVKSGHQVFAINDRPTFFDISKVFKPADRIAWSLQKVASVLAKVGGAELAEQLGVTAPDYFVETPQSRLALPYKLGLKLAAARKLAEIEKQVDAVATGGNNAHLQNEMSGCAYGDVDNGSMGKLQGQPLSSVLDQLGDAKIMLPVKSFLQLVMGNKFDSSIDELMPEVEGLLPSLHGHMAANGETENAAADTSFDGSDGFLPRGIKDLIESLTGSHSLAEAPVGRRVQITIIRGMKPQIKQGSVKTVSKRAELLANEYGKYQISFAAKFGTDATNRLTVLRNHLTV